MLYQSLAYKAKHTLGTTTLPEALTSLEVNCFSKKTLAPMSSSCNHNHNHRQQQTKG
jgi:hypothetical protein